MPSSKKDKSRKKNLLKFKQTAKKMSEQNQIPKSHLIPTTQWETTDILDVRGDVLEALENSLVETFGQLQKLNNDMQRLGNVIQVLIKDNVDKGKIKLSYVWNNGETATEEDVLEFKKKMEEFNKAKEDSVKQQKIQQNAAKTGLVDANGNGIGTEQDLDQAPQKHEVTQQDLNTYPELAENGVKVGDIVDVYPEAAPEKNQEGEKMNTDELSQADSENNAAVNDSKNEAEAEDDLS